MKTAELTGAQLVYWVARALEWKWTEHGRALTHELRHFPDTSTSVFLGARPERVMIRPAVLKDDSAEEFDPSTEWAHGGPIIEREHIRLDGRDRNGRPHEWCASIIGPRLYFGSTALVAAMRAYVGSKFGDEVPDA